MAKRKCKGKAKTGQPCRAVPLTGSDYCSAHDPNLPESLRFGSHAQASAAAVHAGRPRLPRPTDVARNLIEENVMVTLAPHFRALGFDIERGEQGLQLVPSPAGGAKLYGTKQSSGEISMSGYDDLGAQINAAEKLLDRVYGRPKQQVESSGEHRTMVLHLDATQPETRARLHDLLRSRPAVEHD